MFSSREQNNRTTVNKPQEVLSNREFNNRTTATQNNLNNSQEYEPKVDSIWQAVQHEYELLSVAGEGSVGQVYKARNKNNGQLVAIKYLDNVFKDEFTARKILREISIMRQFTQVSGNHFTTKLFDVITPGIEIIKNA